MGVASRERQELTDLLAEVGPDAPTLCEGWQTRDLAAHLVLRENRLDAAPGILIKSLAARTDRIQRELAARPWEDLVESIRNGPTGLSPYRFGAVDELINTVEYFVHLEDIRRARPGWEPRPADRARDDALWSRLRRMAKLSLRRSPVGVALHRPDTGELVLAKRGPRTVTMTGAPGELVLFIFGRREHRAVAEGDQADIAVVKGLELGM